jgi:hypothetical protein
MMQQRAGLPRRQIAITRASVTSWAVIAAFIDQPLTQIGQPPPSLTRSESL